MKKFLISLLCVLLSVSISPNVFTANVKNIELEATLASQLKELGLFLGVGENDDGIIDFDLNRAPSRVEAIIMLIRAMGKGDSAKVYPKTHPFSDVPIWADGYVSYAYENGLTKGVSDTLFGVESAASAEMYVTFMLRALGYSDDNGGEFTWNTPWVLADPCGILPPQVDRTNFLRADVVDVTCAALYAYIKGTETLLHEQLVSAGVFTEEQFRVAFTDNPFQALHLTENRQTSYKEALAYTSAHEYFNISQTLETDICTIQLGSLRGVPHPTASLDLIYKPGSVMGEGLIISLPLQQNGIGSMLEPDSLWLGEDGLSLYYSYYFDERLTINEGSEYESIIHGVGTYKYTVDLTTGKALLNILSD